MSNLNYVILTMTQSQRLSHYKNGALVKYRLCLYNCYTRVGCKLAIIPQCSESSHGELVKPFGLQLFMKVCINDSLISSSEYSCNREFRSECISLKQDNKYCI